MKRQNLPLVLEQLEDRIFLDANPLVVVDSAHDHAEEPAAEVLAEADVESIAVDPENTEQRAEEQPVDNPGDNVNAGAAVDADSDNANVAEQDGVVAGQDDSQQDQELPEDGLFKATQTFESATDSVPIDPMIGENFDFTVTFTNGTGSDVYGPYIDLLLDGGVDHTGGDAGSAGTDGISIDPANHPGTGATYLGADVEIVTIAITSDGQEIDHPWATDDGGDPLKITGLTDDQNTFHAFKAGDQFVSLLMPFGSFTTNQPAAEVQVTAHMGVNADVDVPLHVISTTGAMYGHDALDNPGSSAPGDGDDPLRGTEDNLNQGSLSFLPEVITYRKDIIVQSVVSDCQIQHVPDDDTRYEQGQPQDADHIFEENHQEISTGPNFPATYEAIIDVADGQIVSGLHLTDHLPDNIVYSGDATVSVVDSGGNNLAHRISQVGNDLTITLDADFTGTANHNDVVIKYDFYVPERTSGGDSILDPADGSVEHIINNGVVGYSWTSPDNAVENISNGTINPEVNSDGYFSSNPDIDDISHAQSIAIQKSHTLDNDTGHTGYTPGDRVKFTLDFEISDYFGFGDIVIDDLLADGMNLLTDGGFEPTVQISEGGVSIVNGDLVVGSELVTGVNGTDEETLHFDFNTILGNHGQGTVLDGGYTDNHTNGATRGTITYWAEIQQHYESVTDGEDNVDQGDKLSGGVTINGKIYDYDSNALTAVTAGDESCDEIEIMTGGVSKSIYSISTSGGTDYAVGANPHLSPGEKVTYRIHYNMPFSSTEDFKLTDYLPLPIFDANDPDQDGTDSDWTFDATAYDGTNTPDAGHWGYTTTDTYHNYDSSVSVAAGAGNTLVFDYGEYHDGGDNTAVIDVVFTVTISNDPFADGMFLTNQVHATEKNTMQDISPTDDIIQIVLDEPDLKITKGVVETNNNVADTTAPTFSDNATVDTLFSDPTTEGFRAVDNITSTWLAAHDINTSLENVDAGDVVTMAIVVENTGRSGAFDVRIKDVLPAGYAAADVTNMKITDGADNIVTWKGDSGDNTAADLFTENGITIDDDADGGLDAYSADSGTNILVITYDLTLQNSVGPDQSLTNTATIANYAGANSTDTYTAPNHVPEGIFDTATVDVADVIVDKIITHTSQGHTADSNVTIGEIVTYEVTMTIPEGTATTVSFTDDLDSVAGELALVDLVSITGSAGLTYNTGGGDLDFTNYDLTNPTSINANGTEFSLNFGTVKNANSDNAQDDTIVLTYTAVVLNTSDNVSGDPLPNDAEWSWTDGNNDAQSAEDSISVTIVEPSLEVEKTVDNPSADQGDEVTFTMEVSHGAGSIDAFEAALSDSIPAGFDYVAGSLANTAGVVPTSLTEAGGVISATWATLAVGQTSTISFRATVTSASAGVPITNTANINWSSLSGTGNTDLSLYNTNNDAERTGDTSDPGGAANTYRNSDAASVTTSGSIDKDIHGAAPAGGYKLGDIVTYDIVVTLPEGATDDLIVYDDLPNYMEYVSHSVITDSFSGTLDTTPTVATTGGDGNRVSFDFTDVSVDAAAGSTNNVFTIRVETRITDTDPDVDSTSYTNDTWMTYGDDPDHPGTPIRQDDPDDPTVVVNTTAQIGDFVFFDTDQSHSETVGDTGITNVTLRLSADTDGDGEADFFRTATTDNNGEYWFEHLPGFDSYTVTLDPANLPDEAVAMYDRDGIDSEHVVTLVSLGVAATRDDLDFGYFSAGTGTIGDMVWYDADNDGIQDAEEAGLAGVELTLTGDISGDDHDDISMTTTTDANGNYLFDELLEGHYTVTVTGYPAGMEQTFDLDGLATAHNATLDLADGEQNNNVDFGYTGSADIGDTIYFDADNNGSMNGDDVGLSGVTVTLTGDFNNDGIEDTRTTTTNSTGGYLFENLRDGNYKVTVDSSTLPAGMVQRADPDDPLAADYDNESDVILAGGANDLDQDFGYTGTGTIGDRIWNDLNSDGVQDAGEFGLNGVNVTVEVDFDGDGTVDYTSTVTTAGSDGAGNDTGHYSFDNLPAGTYTISVDTNSAALANSILTGDPDNNPDSTSTVVLAAGASNNDQDFGYHDAGAATGSIGDYIWFDSDHNGNDDDGLRSGIGGVTVTLVGDIDGDGDVDTVTTITDSDGKYLFDNLATASSYTVTVDETTLPAGMTNTHDPDGVGLAPGDGVYTIANLGAAVGGPDVDTVDFGYDGTGSIGDTIYFDGNNDGDQDTNEGGILGVTVQLDLDLDGDGIFDLTERTTTDQDGHYTFTNLPAGEYTITVDPTNLPAGMQQSADPDASLDGRSTLTLAGGENNPDQDFGYTGNTAIGDRIWNDVNGDGVQDAGEIGMANVDIRLEADIDGDHVTDYVVTVTTDANGNYKFENLPSGDYTLTVDPATLPAGMNQSGDPDGGNDNTSTVIGLVAGTDNMDQDFGYNSGTGRIGDTIFFDEDGSGGQNGTEQGIAGVTVTLTGDVDGDGTQDTVTAVTDSHGNYFFENLAAGTYTVTVDNATLPAGMTNTADPFGANDGVSTVDLAAGATDSNQDFGYQGAGSIGNYIWEDTNGDGQQDGGETGINGVGVTLEVDFDGDGNADYTMTTTTATVGGVEGSYLFDNLPAGEYTIKVDTNSAALVDHVLTGDPDSNPDSTSTVILAADVNNDTQDFGYKSVPGGTGSIGDRIWFDANNNGLDDDGATSGMGGVTVTLLGDIDGDGDIDTVTTTTDANGGYLFDNLALVDATNAAVRYTVTVDESTLPAGMTNTHDPDGVGLAPGDGVYTIADLGTAIGGPDVDTVDFGYTGTGTIGDTIYFDTDGDGVQDTGEHGKQGVAVTITVDLDGDGVAEYTERVTTDPNGKYSFDHLPAGEYTISVDPAGLPAGSQPSGDPDGTPDNTATVTLAGGETNNNQDFGYTGSGSIGDTIYFDADGNGYQSPGERGFSGVGVTLQGDFDDDGTIDSVRTTTDANGHYLFEGLIAGTYTVYVDSTTLPAGLTQTGDPDATLDDQSSVTLVAGENNVDQDFGYGGIFSFITPVIPTPDVPVPVAPIIPVVPSSPVAPHPAPVPQEQGIIADAFFMHRQFGGQTEDDIFFYPFDETPWLEPMVPVSPIYTGHAEPGTTLEFVLYDAMGNQIAYQSVMADSAGDWLVSFPGTLMFDLPHHMEIQQTASTYNASTAGFFNMRVFYNPNFSSMVFSSASLDVETIFAYLPSTVIESVHMVNMSLLNLEWDNFDGYEFIAPSTHPSNSGH